MTSERRTRPIALKQPTPVMPTCTPRLKKLHRGLTSYKVTSLYLTHAQTNAQVLFMAKNDTILLDAILQQAAEAANGVNKGEIFEQFALEQILKNFDLTKDEIESGWTDGGNDGGIDGFYVFVNGILLTDAKDFQWPKTSAELQVYIVTCKHRDGFQQAPLDSLLASLQEIFDLDKSDTQLIGSYSNEIKEARSLFIAAYKQLSLHRPKLAFSIYYASRGETHQLGQSISARGHQLAKLITSYFSASKADFTALGSTELVELYREVKSFALDLPVQECLTSGQEGYVVLAKLGDFCSFVGDEKKQLRRYLFDSNVRAYLGSNLVNADIAETLSNSSAPNFWWLNNGVTILATSASLVGKTLKLKDIQIVNGLQTTESIFRHFTSIEFREDDQRSLLVKVIVSQDENVRDQVIRATNNQTSVEPAALHATDRIQRDIEQILLKHEWYYERRTNYFKNEGRPSARIISPIVLASGSVALLLKNPGRSSKLKQKNLRPDEAYQAVYAEFHPIDAWPAVVTIIRESEKAILGSHTTKRGGRSQHLSAWRGVLAYVIASRVIGTFSFDPQALAKIDLSIVTESFASETWQIFSTVDSTDRNAKVGESRIITICNHAAALYDIKGVPLSGKRELPTQTKSVAQYSETVFDDEDFLIAVNSALPDQPWKPGSHAKVAKDLKVGQTRVNSAIQTLIRRGLRYKQKDGVVFDRHGVEIMRDLSRAPVV